MKILTSILLVMIVLNLILDLTMSNLSAAAGWSVALILLINLIGEMCGREKTK